MHEDQVALWDEFMAFVRNDGVVFPCLIGRQWGKSVFSVLSCLSACIKQEDIRVVYAAPSREMLRDIVIPTMEEVLQSCPENIRPTFHEHKKRYTFANGSYIKLAGLDKGNHKSARGARWDLAVVDEAGFVDELDEVVFGAIMPAFQHTSGVMLMPSTPPISPSHPFMRMVGEAESTGHLPKVRTVYNNPLLNSRQVERLKGAAGGENSDRWKREYMAQAVTDSSRAIVPEFYDVQSEVVAEVPKDPYYPYYKKYVVMDPGFEDLTAIVFAYVDFQKAMLVIEDEIMLHHANTDKIANRIRIKEKALWSENKGDICRISDVDLRLIADLNSLYSLNFSPTRKDNREAAINQLRIKTANREYVIHPRCTNTIAHLKYGIWNHGKTQFDRADGFGHFDFVAAMVYLVRNSDFMTNPIPPIMNMDGNTFINRPSARRIEKYNKGRGDFSLGGYRSVMKSLRRNR